jgi:hypothetical protein
MATIRQNALCIELAKCLHYLGAAYHAKAARDFDTLPGIEKQRLIEEAELSCESLRTFYEPARPDYFDLAATMARGQAAKVLARITPETPWGDPVLDSRD